MNIDNWRVIGALLQNEKWFVTADVVEAVSELRDHSDKMHSDLVTATKEIDALKTNLQKTREYAKTLEAKLKTAAEASKSRTSDVVKLQMALSERDKLEEAYNRQVLALQNQVYEYTQRLNDGMKAHQATLEENKRLRECLAEKDSLMVSRERLLKEVRDRIDEFLEQ